MARQTTGSTGSAGSALVLVAGGGLKLQQAASSTYGSTGFHQLPAFQLVCGALVVECMHVPRQPACNTRTGLPLPCMRVRPYSQARGLFRATRASEAPRADKQKTKDTRTSK
jgi:hypothetical protein